ncbi:hypothetical protein ACN28E_19280 [Archangium lansingense]|uniref:hypothetical protein n=1 Tax=Archangium lansingense TaxID=2995310 RepID=UPI003B80B289
MNASRLSLLAPLLLATTAEAAPRHEVSAGLSTMFQMGTFRPSPNFMLVEVAGLRTVAEEGPLSALQFGGGLRVGWPSAQQQLPLEGFLRVQLGAKLGFWQPAGGLELGLTGFNQRLYTPVLPDNQLEPLEDETLGPAYGSFTMSPARFQVGRFQLSALQLHLGTGLKTPGSSVRVQLGLVSIGGWL